MGDDVSVAVMDSGRAGTEARAGCSGGSGWGHRSYAERLGFDSVWGNDQENIATGRIKY